MFPRNMNFPWVSRRAFDVLERAHTDARREVERLQAQATEYHNRLMALTAQPVAAKTTGEMPGRNERKRDDVLMAVLERAGNNRGLASHLSKWAMQQRRKGVADDDIINEMFNIGQLADEDEGGVPID